MSNPRVYLAGPMHSLSYVDATTWRFQAAEALKAAGIDAYSPLRDKTFLAEESLIDSFAEPHTEHPLATSRAIITRDFQDTTNADVVLINFKGSEVLSVGTVAEMAWCWDRKIPTVVVADVDDRHLQHPFVKEMTSFHVQTLEEGLALVKSILLPHRGAV